jgi:hypothetical protein
MSAEFRRLISLVDAYLASDDYMALWHAIDGPGALDREPGPFEPREEPLELELHEIVHYGQKESATLGERRNGLVGGPELHARLSEWRAAALQALSAENP